MTQYGMLENIVDHSIKVTRVALFLSRELNKRGQRIDLELVEAASLLHDLTKTECLTTRKDHAKTGCKVLQAMGYERVAQVVAEHIVLSKGKNPSSVSEEEVVNYADKRVQHTRIVSLEERFEDLLERYGVNDQWAAAHWEQLKRDTFEIEVKIFSFLNIDPGNLDRLSFEKEPEDRGEVDDGIID